MRRYVLLNGCHSKHKRR